MGGGEYTDALRAEAKRRRFEELARTYAAGGVVLTTSDLKFLELYERATGSRCTNTVVLTVAEWPRMEISMRVALDLPPAADFGLRNRKERRRAQSPRGDRKRENFIHAVSAANIGRR